MWRVSPLCLTNMICFVDAKDIELSCRNPYNIALAHTQSSLRNNMNETKINIFFAIPCGEFFSIQDRIIKSVCEAANIHPIIIEDHSKTSGLWEKIIDQIDSADYFIADVSSLSPNVLIELGYSIREKKSKYYAIFIANNIRVPVDLQGFTLQKYSSIRDFQNKLIKWISDNIPFIDKTKFQHLETLPIGFHEDFKDYDRFLRLWTFPPQCSFQLTHEGLRFTNAHFPIMTTHLALLSNYEFEFRAKIESGHIGWIVKGTRPFNSYLPTFCVMFNINRHGQLRPHIFNINNPDPESHYKLFDIQQVELHTESSKEDWFLITTKVIEDKITILNNDRVIFEQDFNQAPYKEFFEFQNKQGEIGFRCYPGEQAIINYITVKEIER